MDWRFVLILLVPLAVWVLSSIFRPSEEERRGERRRAGEGPPRRPATELDRFLEEARRRKGAGRPAEAPERPPEARPEARVERVPLPARPVAPAAPPRPRQAPAAERRPSLGREGRAAEPAPPPRRPVAEPALVVQPVLVVPPPPPPPAPAAPAPVVLAPAPPVGGAVSRKPERPTSTFLTQLAALLQKKETVGAAVVLREIFDRPLCDRGPRF
jgi:hypothetical protein